MYYEITDTIDRYTIEHIPTLLYCYQYIFLTLEDFIMFITFSKPKTHDSNITLEF